MAEGARELQRLAVRLGAEVRGGAVQSEEKGADEGGVYDCDASRGEEGGDALRPRGVTGGQGGRGRGRRSPSSAM